LFEKNPNYWDADTVKLQKINMIYVEEEASRHQMFQAKQLDLIGARGDYAAKYMKMVEAKQLDCTLGYSPCTYYVIYNCQTGGNNKLFTNAKIRLAFGLALDRDDYVNNLWKRGYVAYGLIPPTLMIGDKEYRKEVPEPYKELVDKKQDPKELFKEGLTELGLDPNAQYTVRYLDSGTSSTDKLFQEWYQQQWESKLGVKIQLDVAADEPQYWEKVDGMDYDICTYGWAGDFNDPETFFNLFTTGNSNNPGKWTSKEYDDMYAKTKATNDNNERLELYRQMEKLLVVDSAAIAPYAYLDTKAFRQPYLKGVQYTLFGSTDFKYAYTSGRQ
jgi:oligopeptide transport system substrate-binding protein